jgi:5-(carboxyamino)imidazole ribonucleotide synthase
MGEKECVLEQKIQLEREVSVVLARSETGSITNFPVAENAHVNGILHSTMVPASVSAEQAQSAIQKATEIARGLGYIGTMAVEFFVSTDGDIIANEIAPRPHNSGHYTLDACHTSQFEQQVRMLCGLPAGNCDLVRPVVMINILGDVWGNCEPKWDQLLAEPNVKLHLYGKKEARPGRKMGHFNVLAANTDDAMAQASRLFDAIQGE